MNVKEFFMAYISGSVICLLFVMLGYWIGINEIKPEPECVDTEIHKQPVWDGVKHELVPVVKCLKPGVKVP